ncbi:hypothetical protein PN498_22325 [Oscillatoria sp. CS-180]|uniref:hypothetical protein n=1 Tax=Oscillatoria sp. CS-180 TaxID=3021720 RepID=UPI00232E847B|nr:hypothetical protein [Oscillatoria sp. CS-180]MDB9528745.1 hypothetical protein [Oscillatoria sp. CS-180]
MEIKDITNHLNTLFKNQVQFSPPDAWQVETEEFRLLVLLSSDQSWLRLLVPIVPIQVAQPYFAQILGANFDLTQEVRYALSQDVLWGVFQYDLESLTIIRFESAISRLLMMKREGIDPFFNALAEQQIRQIIAAAKQRGQSLEETMQTLDRFYSEGMMGDMADSEYQDQVLEAWRRQLERLWTEEE